MKLPFGITGLWDMRDPRRPPARPDVRIFRGHCYEAAHGIGARVLSVTEPWHGNLPRSFSLGLLETPQETVAILLNLQYPFLAFAEPPLSRGFLVRRFRDYPVLADQFQIFGIYEILTMAEIEQPPTDDALSDLTKGERKEVRHWQPRHLGDVIFNFWD
jgi:hypothetical protein